MAPPQRRPDARADGGSDRPPAPAALLDRIRSEIRNAGGFLPFARFMELALYDPLGGYYSGGPGRIGRDGDFFTASDAGHAFGRAIARQLEEIDRRAGPFDPFDVLEIGSGRGLLARDVIDALRDAGSALGRRLRYHAIDRSERMRRAAAENAPEALHAGPDAPGTGHRGAILAVELFDALPVHRVRRAGGRLIEVGVGLGGDERLVEREAPAPAELERAADRFGAAREEGDEAEICAAADAMLAWMAGLLDRGVILIVDYGDRADRLYGRGSATLRTFRRHRVEGDCLVEPGGRDLTADVNFTQLEQRARELGLEVVGSTTQDRFLVANGILSEFEAPDLETARDPRRVKARLQAMQLIHPQGMGRAFRVLFLAKGFRPDRLDGLRDPFARGSRGPDAPVY